MALHSADLPDYLNDYKWSRSAMKQWQERTRRTLSLAPSSTVIPQNIGIKYRRYSAG